MLSKSYLAVAIWLAGLLPSASADTCYNFGVGPVGTCYVDPRAVEKFEAYLNYDNSNPACNSGSEVDMSLVYVDTQGNTKTAKALAPLTVADAASTVDLMPFNVPLTSMAPNAAATLFVYAYADLANDVTTSVVWTPSPLSTIAYTVGKAVATAYTTVAALPTTIHGEGQSYTTITPGANSRTKTLTTKIATVTQPAPSVTVTTRVTPGTITSTHWAAASTTTKTFSCDPNATGAAPHRAKRNFFDATLSAPKCGVAPATTTITTRVSTSTTTVTSTTQMTVLSTTKKVTTRTFAGKTKYVGATSTTTTQLPANTFHVWTKLPVPTVVVTSTRTTTAWVNPGKASGSGACKPPQTYSLSATAQISTAPAAAPVETGQ